MPTSQQGRSARRYRVFGPHAGRDIVLAGYRFVGGEVTIELSAAEHASLSRVLGFYQAREVPDGQPDIQAGADPGEPVHAPVAHVRGDVRPDGESAATGGIPAAVPVREAHDTPTVPAQVELGPLRHGQEASVGRLRAVLLGLDSANDAHWTAGGKPALGPVAALLGSQVTRAQIETALPGLHRGGFA